MYGNYIDEVLMMVVKGDPDADYYYVHDQIYSPVALLEHDGTIVERYEYNAYGKLSRLNPNFTTFNGTEAGNPYYFTGRQLDTLDDGDLELMYYRNRSYDPTTGRFLQHDPFDFIDGLNLYQYVSSKPLTMLDPKGESPTYNPSHRNPPINPGPRLPKPGGIPPKVPGYSTPDPTAPTPDDLSPWPDDPSKPGFGIPDGTPEVTSPIRNPLPPPLPPSSCPTLSTLEVLQILGRLPMMIVIFPLEAIVIPTYVPTRPPGPLVGGAA